MGNFRLARSHARLTGLTALALFTAATAGSQALEPGDLVVADRQGTGPARLIRIERATGSMHSLYASFDGVLVSPRDLEIDGAGRIFASQSAIPTRPAPESIARVDPVAGTATLVSQGGLLHDVDGIGIAADGALLAADHGSAYGIPASIVRIDATTGAQSLVTSGGELLRPIDVLADGASDLLVLDDGSGSGAKLIRVNAASGAQTVLVAPGALGNAAGGFARDSDGSIVVASAFGALYRVTPAGAVTSLAGAPGLPTLDIALEPDGDVLLLEGGSSDRIDRVDVATSTAKTLATGLGTPQGVAVVPAVTPFCDVEVDQPSYGNGDVVRVTTLRFVNPGVAPFPTRLRLQVKVAMLATPLGLVDASVALPARFDTDLAAFNMIAVQPSLPRGGYELRCALESPATGETQYEDRTSFGLH